MPYIDKIQIGNTSYDIKDSSSDSGSGKVDKSSVSNDTITEGTIENALGNVYLGSTDTSSNKTSLISLYPDSLYIFGEHIGVGTLNNSPTGQYSYAEGVGTGAAGDASHAQNYGTAAQSDYQTALGKFNIPDPNDAYAVIIGNGTDNENRSNALTVGWDGEVTASGDIIDGDGNILSDIAAAVGSRNTYYTTCGTVATTAAKVITVTGWTPVAGDILGVLFFTANTVDVPTLTINSTNYTIRIGNNAPNGTNNVLKWSPNTMLYFMYNGSSFSYIGAQTAGSNISPNGSGTWHGTCGTSASTAAKTSAITNFRLTPGTIISLTCTTANTYTAGTLTLNINSTGAKNIYVNNVVTSSTNTLTWNAGELLTFVYTGSYWHFLGRSKAQVTQTVTSGTEIAKVDGTPIYAPSGDGSGKVDAETTNGTDTAIINNVGGAIEFAATDGTNDMWVNVGPSLFTIEATDGTNTSGITVESGNVTISNSGIAASRVMITGSAGDVQTSSVTSTELYRLSGITSNVQDQIDTKLATSAALSWENVLLDDFATVASDWSFVTNGCGIQYNAALGAVRVRLQVQTSVAQTAGSKTLFTIKSAYRPKTFPAAIPSITANAQTAQIWTTGGFSPIVAAITAGTSLQFNGVYFIGS